MITLTPIRNIINRLYVTINNKRTSKFLLTLARKRIVELKKNNKYRISIEQKKKAKDFFRRYSYINTEFHEFYYLSTGIFDVRYIPNDFHYATIDRFYNNRDKAKVIDNKTLYSVLFSDLPQPETKVYRSGRFWYDKDNKIISTEKALDILEKSENFFIKKAENSDGGHGVKHYYGALGKKDEIKEIFSEWKCDVIVQKGVEQSKVLGSINPSSVNSIRILTLLKKDGSVKVISCFLRMGINGSKVDNACSGGITVGIRKDGRLKPKAYSINGKSYSHHPNSGVAFETVVIPNFDKAVEMVVNKAKVMPHFRLISWDIAIDCNDNPILIEANLRIGGITSHQLNNGPLFGEDTESVLAEVFGAEEN